jgi:hypothetical protein
VYAQLGDGGDVRFGDDPQDKRREKLRRRLIDLTQWVWEEHRIRVAKGL